MDQVARDHDHHGRSQDQSGTNQKDDLFRGHGIHSDPCLARGEAGEASDCSSLRWRLPTPRKISMVSQAMTTFVRNMTRAASQVGEPDSSLLARAVTTRMTRESGVRNFQLKASIWSMRIRGMEYLTHMMTQYPTIALPRKITAATRGACKTGTNFSRPNTPYPPKYNIATKPPKVKACSSSPA